MGENRSPVVEGLTGYFVVGADGGHYDVSDPAFSQPRCCRSNPRIVAPKGWERGTGHGHLSESGHSVSVARQFYLTVGM
ncbi:MAG: hypothetical protein AAFX94_13555 [Myxococcota bacterium]